jgi:replicative DNA helicase
MDDRRKALLEKLQNDILEKQKLISELNESHTQLETLRVVRDRVKSKGTPVKYLTGVAAIDDNMGGFSEGSFINIAGVNFSGKTTLVLNILTNIAKYNRIVFFSFEMYENLLVTNKLKDTSIDDNLVLVQDKNLLIDIEDIIRNEFKTNGVIFFAIDSMMKIRVIEKMQDNQKASLISSTLAKLSQELGVIILLINQVALTDIREKRLEFKGSGDISYDSDVSFFITVDEKDNSRTLHCKKDRINERIWKEDITDRQYQVKTTVYKNTGTGWNSEPEITNYNNIDMPDILN